MDTTSPIAISPVLREVAELKFEELNRAKQVFNRRYDLDIRRSIETDIVQRVKSLLDDINKLNPELEKDDDLDIICRYVEQAQDDRSVSESKMSKFEEQIWNKLDSYYNRLEISSLHVQLIKEAMDAGESTASATAKLESVELDDEFEVVENELDEVLEKFEKNTFTNEEVDVEAIEAYLSSLFVDPHDKQDLKEIRNDLQEFSEEILADGMEIDQDFLMWCIMDLLKSDLVSEVKKKTLQSYLQSPIALREMSTTMNMKSARDWDYKNADQGLPVTARQNADGQHCIAVEESIIDLLFLHAMGIGWAMKLKGCLMDFVRNCQSFTIEGLSTDEKDKREYFLGRKPSIPKASTCNVCHAYYPPAPMPPPPMMGMGMPPPPPGVVVIDSPKKTKSKRKSSWLPLPPPPPAYNSLASTRNNTYIREFFMSRLPVQEGCTAKVTPSEDVQAKLIKTLAVEAKLHELFDDGVDASSVHFDSLASSIPHKTILVVLKFLGVSETFLDFFERFLTAKLNIGPAVRGAPDRILPRTRGVPEGHALELFFTEAVMFILELAVHQKTGSYLYRLKDTGYYVEPLETQNACGTNIVEFARIMGLDATFALEQDIGLVSITTSGLIIDEDKVATYARRVKKRLSCCTTVLDWVRVWNNTAGTYDAHLFGPLAEVFGKPHLEAAKKAYNRVFDIIFEGGNLTSHVKHLLTTHLNRPLTDPPFSIEALIYLPQAYGGLGVKNPFITLNLAHELGNNTDKLLTDYLDAEETYYQRAAENYKLLPADSYARKIEIIYENNDARVIASLGANRDLTAFMTKEELTTHRERAAYPALPSPPFPATFSLTPVPSLTSPYANLLREPIDDIPCTEKISDEVRRLSGKGDMKYWGRLSGEDKWVLQLYSNECFERYGGLEIWCGESVPLEILKAIRGATWDDADDASSYMSDV